MKQASDQSKTGLNKNYKLDNIYEIGFNDRKWWRSEKKNSCDPFLKQSLAYHQSILKYDEVWILNITPAQNWENNFFIDQRICLHT